MRSRSLHLHARKFARELRGEDIYKITLDAGQNATAEYLKAPSSGTSTVSCRPCRFAPACLPARLLSPPGTGNTEFANTYAAYEALSDEHKAMLEGFDRRACAGGTQSMSRPELELMSSG